MQLLKSYLMAARTPDEFRNAYINALFSSGPLQKNRAIALKHYMKPDTVRRIEQVDLAKKRTSQILDDKIPCAFVINGRKKSFLSYTKKILTKDPTSVHDLYGFRVILDDTRLGTKNMTLLCYDVAKWLIDEFQTRFLYEVKEVKTNSNGILSDEIRNGIYIPSPENIDIADYSKLIKNYIMLPKDNGYQGLHILLCTQQDFFIEVQIRTWSMHLWAEYGLANHKKIYKPKDDIDLIIANKPAEFLSLITPSQIGEKITIGEMPKLRDIA